MNARARRIVLAAGVLAVLGAAGPARSEDAQAVLKNRQSTMKRMSGDLKTIREYGQGKGDQQKAVAAATDIDETLPKLHTLFPKGTGMAEFPGDSGAKPAIWTEWDKFLGAEKDTEQKAGMLLAAIRRGDQAAAAAGPADLWDNGCQGCHKSYRAKKS